MIKRKLNKSVYELNAIRSVISVYSNYCKTKISNIDAYYVIELSDCIYGEEQTINEFCNAVLIETIRRKGSLYD